MKKKESGDVKKGLSTGLPVASSSRQSSRSSTTAQATKRAEQLKKQELARNRKEKLLEQINKMTQNEFGPLLNTSEPHFFRPFIESNKLKISGGKSFPVGIGKELQDNYMNYVSGTSYDEGEGSLADFIATQLALSKDFNGVTLGKDFIKDKAGNSMDAYSFPKKNLNLSQKGIEESHSPFTTFIHEGTHALDDLRMRTYQKDAIDFLAKNIKNPINSSEGISLEDDRGGWYRAAQNILPVPSFNKLYPWGTMDKKFSGAVPGIAASIVEADREAGNKNVKGGNRINFDYEGPKSDLDTIRGKGNMPSNRLFNGLSEFPAFAMESLHKPWIVNDKSHLSSDERLGRKFLKTMVKGTRREFNTMEPDFARRYPDVDRNFQDRLNEIRNQKYYAGAEGLRAYQEYLDVIKPFAEGPDGAKNIQRIKDARNRVKDPDNTIRWAAQEEEMENEARDVRQDMSGRDSTDYKSFRAPTPPLSSSSSSSSFSSSFRPISPPSPSSRHHSPVDFSSWSREGYDSPDPMTRSPGASSSSSSISFPASAALAASATASMPAGPAFYPASPSTNPSSSSSSSPTSSVSASLSPVAGTPPALDPYHYPFATQGFPPGPYTSLYGPRAYPNAPGAGSGRGAPPPPPPPGLKKGGLFSLMRSKKKKG